MILQIFLLSLTKQIHSVTEKMFLFKGGFSSLIKVLSSISSFKLHVLLSRTEKSLGQTTTLQESN